jgi:hypothetical protein
VTGVANLFHVHVAELFYISARPKLHFPIFITSYIAAQPELHFPIFITSYISMLPAANLLGFVS